VTASAQLYKGFTPYKMDPKFRVSIPTAWRPEAGAVLFLLFSKTHDMPVIKVLTQQAFDERVETVKNSDLTPAKKAAYLGSLSMLCREASVNDQGKLLVPKDLSEKAGISADSEVVLAGRGMHFEVWNKENHERVLEIEMAQDDADELGIL
jgi:DNA-binding transcriptional regulator/RsmH inhibitor MraZ